MPTTTKGRQLADKLNPLIGSTNEIDHLCRKICWNAAKHHTLAERQCCDETWSDEDDLKVEKLEKHITELVSWLPWTEDGPLTVEFQHDPRGCTVKLKVDNLERHPSYDGWALEAIIVP